MEHPFLEILASDAFLDLPPKAALSLTETADQKAWWFIQREMWGRIYENLTCFFCGLPKPPSHPDGTRQQIIDQKAYELRRLYELVWEAWPELSRAQFPLMGLDIAPPTSAAHFFKVILALDAAGSLAWCLKDGNSYSPQVSHRELRQLDELLAQGFDQIFIDQLNAKCDRRHPNAQTFQILRDWCIGICEKSKTPRVKQSLRDYRMAQADGDRLYLKLTHPVKKQSGGKWEDGVFLPSRKGARHRPNKG